MKKFILLCMLLVCGMYGWCAQRITFTVDGPEDAYNQIRIVNETSATDFRCRITRMNEDGSMGELFGIYTLKGPGDKDSKTAKVQKGEQFALDMPNDFPIEAGYAIEYLDLPLFDMIVIHLTEADEFAPLQ